MEQSPSSHQNTGGIRSIDNFTIVDLLLPAAYGFGETHLWLGLSLVIAVLDLVSTLSQPKCVLSSWM
jgi:hypothetical protein